MRLSLFILCIAGWVTICNAQNKKKKPQSFDEFRKEINDDFNNFRREITEEFIDFVRDPWKSFASEPPIKKPEEKPVEPLVIPENDRMKGLPLEDKSIVIENVIKPIPINPQPLPIEPIEEVPIKKKEKTAQFVFYGTSCTVRNPLDEKYYVEDVDENTVADALKILVSDKYDNLIYDCLKIRDDLQLCDWAYLQFLQVMSDTLCQGKTNEATLLMSYVYLQSGYKMRLAHDGKRLYMLFSCHHIIFDKSSYEIDGDNFYCLDELPDRLMISDASFPEEQSLSLEITQQPLFTIDISKKRTVSSEFYSKFKFSFETNKNLISFYNSYPCSYYNDNFMTQWSLYANTPIAPNIGEVLYPAIKKAIVGLSEYEAVNCLLNWVQTGFKYEFDEKIWGHNRTFFAEESLYYPYCDCEDRSILLSRIVRDILKLKCVLVYYPGHLATAVRFNENVKGDYISVNGQKFVVCDPTYIGADIGMTMPGMDNSSASIILLE